jgi:hypothetical protein
MRIAVLTTSQLDYERYYKSQPKELKTLLKRITVLSDVSDKTYLKAVFLHGSRNVTDKVLSLVSEKSSLIEDLTLTSIY